LRPGLDLTGFNRLADQLEDEAIIEASQGNDMTVTSAFQGSADPPDGFARHPRSSPFLDLIGPLYLGGCSMRSRLLCLTAYLDQDPATRAGYLSPALSRACHYHSYELAPTAAELTGWLDEATDLVTLLQARARA